jgi:hypothetical protein
MQVADEFADGGVGDAAQSRRFETGRGEIGYELGEVLAIVRDGVRRGVLNSA